MLAKRVITGVIALAVVLGALFYLPPVLVLLLIAAIVVAGGYEWGRFVSPNSPSVALLFPVLLIPLLLASEVLVLPSMSLTLGTLVMAQILWLVAIILLFRFPVRFSSAATTVVGLVLLTTTFVALAALYLSEQGALLLLVMLIFVWAADVGAYFAGKQFGQRKLAPSVSPGKSWEGAIGGLVLVAMIAYFVAPLLKVQPLVMVGIALPGAALSIVGDLTVSMFKRNAGLKDSGTLFPGHGGVMDRIDSISAAMPLFALLWYLNGR